MQYHHCILRIVQAKSTKSVIRNKVRISMLIDKCVFPLFHKTTDIKVYRKLDLFTKFPSSISHCAYLFQIMS